MPPPPDAGSAVFDGRAASPTLPSLPEAFRSVAVPRGAKVLRKMLAFAGPGCLVAVGYMDPGNWATDIAGGSRFGYALLPVIVLSNLVAMVLQHLSLKLGVATGMDLAQACRARFNRPVGFVLWIAAEVAIIACDLAEVIGTAVALKLLFGIPLLAGVALTVLDSLIVLALMRRGFRYIEAFVGSLLLLVGLCFGFELLLAQPSVSAIAGSLIPSTRVVTDPAMLYIALGIFGATVMPHNLYLHSSIIQTRNYERNERGRREAIKYGTLDSTVALGLALMINAAILILAAAAFHGAGHTDVGGIEDAHRLLTPLLGGAAASIVFAVALLASGQNSTLTGTLAGQIVMEGFLGLKLHPALRRLLTRGLAVVPALIVGAIAGEHATMQLLILSQVVLSLQLAFAVVPLVMFTSDRKLMGPFVNGPLMRRAGWGLSLLIVLVNGWLVFQTFAG